MKYYENYPLLYMGEYPAIYLPNHHKAAQCGLVYVHYLVAEKILGRELNPEECVRHINEDKSDYSEKNLMIFATLRDHQRYHTAIKYKSNYCLIKKEGVFYCIVGDNYVTSILKTHDEMNGVNAIFRSACPKCGKLKAKGATLCIDCYRKEIASRIPNKEELEEQLRQYKNFSKIARVYGVSDNAVRRWCKKYGLPYRAKELKQK